MSCVHCNGNGCIACSGDWGALPLREGALEPTRHDLTYNEARELSAYKFWNIDVDLGSDPFCPRHGRRSRPIEIPGLRCDCGEARP